MMLSASSGPAFHDWNPACKLAFGPGPGERPRPNTSAIRLASAISNRELFVCTDTFFIEIEFRIFLRGGSRELQLGKSLMYWRRY